MQIYMHIDGKTHGAYSIDHHPLSPPTLGWNDHTFLALCSHLSE
jgi:hypothetical protein